YFPWNSHAAVRNHNLSGDARIMDSGPIGKYQVVGILGSGAHSKILHIRRDRDKRHYALKQVSIACKEDRRFLEQARHEYEVAQMLDHPRLIKVYRLEASRDWLFRVREVKMLM